MKDFIVTRTGRIVHRVRQVKLAVVHQVPTNWKLWTYSPNAGTETYPTRPAAAQAAFDAQMQIMNWFDAHQIAKGAPVSFEHGRVLDHMEAFSVDPGPLAETVDCASGSWTEIQLSDCAYGCKVYARTNGATTEREVMHSATYGCPQGR